MPCSDTGKVGDRRAVHQPLISGSLTYLVPLIQTPRRARSPSPPSTVLIPSLFLGTRQEEPSAAGRKVQLGTEGRRFGGEELPLHYKIPLTPHLETATLMYSYEEVPACIQPPSNLHIWQEWILCPALSYGFLHGVGAGLHGAGGLGRGYPQISED